MTPTTAAVYDALTRVDALAGWWTEDTRGSGDTVGGGTLAFRFPAGGFDMEVVELVPSERVVWRVVDGPAEWVGATVEWDLRQEGEHATVLFAHRSWREPVEFMQHHVGVVPPEPQVARGDRHGCAFAPRRAYRQRELSGGRRD
ncbi:SRPBCC family protein [Cellulomonas sp. NPDC055163]